MSGSEPSNQLDKPYVMLGFNAIVADTDEEAELLATSVQQAFVSLRTGMPIHFHRRRRGMSTSCRSRRARSSARCYRRPRSEARRPPGSQLDEFVQRTRPDELIVTAQVYDLKARLRSFELLDGSGPLTLARIRQLRRPMSALFTPLEVGTFKPANRIVIAPMCQYSAEEGCMTDWHIIHLGHLALSGAALLTIEATAVTPEGRITYGDTGLWCDANEEAMAHVLASIRRWSDIPVAIQLGMPGARLRPKSLGSAANRSGPMRRTDGRPWRRRRFHFSADESHQRA